MSIKIVENINFLLLLKNTLLAGGAILAFMLIIEKMQSFQLILNNPEMLIVLLNPSPWRRMEESLVLTV